MVHTKKGPEHVGEGEEKKGSSTKRINGPHSRPSKYEVDDTKAETCPQSGVVGNTALLEDGARIERDDVDAAHLLGNHDNTRGPGGASDARNGEQLNEAREHVVGYLEAGLFQKKLLLIQKALDIVEISGSLDRVVSKSQE